MLDSVAVESPDGTAVTVFAVNRDQRESLPLTVDLRGYPGLAVAHHTYVGDGDPQATNTAAHPNRVAPRTAAPSTVEGGKLEISLPPLSWNMIRVSPSQG
ncbi:alpha-L-arabinofuranosidase C-terminal domain-containing protein [Fodinicola feengrottensis]|uniref:alpha-L-arabinofuranosidase C-terminal domain-containing protein n=1 Tax=Fodinicola feengrottensis TaxID=435914 RepID=UPI00244125BC|nr:alpha-L-arabinofuranosidase C-terminal domain-containing protein [Fodinicola feengrottensis]